MAPGTPGSTALLPQAVTASRTQVHAGAAQQCWQGVATLTAAAYERPERWYSNAAVTRSALCNTVVGCAVM